MSTPAAVIAPYSPAIASRNVFVDNITFEAADHTEPLRAFRVDVLRAGSHIPIGAVSGWMLWGADRDSFCEHSDVPHVLLHAARGIFDEHPVENVILVDRMVLEPEHRGRRLNGAILLDLADLLSPCSDETVVVLQPEPLGPAGLGYDRGAFRDRAVARLRAAYEHCGFRPWVGSRSACPAVYWATSSTIRRHP